MINGAIEAVCAFCKRNEVARKSGGDIANELFHTIQRLRSPGVLYKHSSVIRKIKAKKENWRKKGKWRKRERRNERGKDLRYRG